MPEPQTHYQLSFTTRQAMALFVGLLLALGIAYFLGLMTGLSGRENGKAAAGTTPVATPEPTAPVRIAAAAGTPTAIRPLRTAAAAVPPFPRPVLGKEPTSAPNLQFFEDREQSETIPSPVRSVSPRPKTPPGPGPAAGEFWVQILSVSSEQEARSRRDKLIHNGYRARVIQGEGSRGPVYRVRVGPYSAREQAEKASLRLSREEKVQAWIVPAGK